MAEPFFKREYIPLSKLVNNTGQIEGVPKNPRFIRDTDFYDLVEDMKEDPEMLELKELWVVPFEGKFVVIAGNMRKRAAQEIGLKEVPCKVLPADVTPKKLRGWAIKDNLEKGDWDYDLIANEWEIEETEEWGLKTPVWDDSEGMDYSELDESELDAQVAEMKGNVRSAIQIEFHANDFEEAKELVRASRNRGIYIGKILISALKLNHGNS